MRILVVHNRYRSALPSGENRVVDDEVAMMREAGLEVETFFRESDDIEHFSVVQRLALAVKPIYSREAVKAFERRLDGFHPDVVHLHNPFPLISPWVVRIARRVGVPVVQTVHNYRHVCAAATFFRDGRICEDCCEKRIAWPAVSHACYRGSRAQSAVMAAALAYHRKTWAMIGQFLPVSEFVGEHLEKMGIPREKITVKYNAVPDPGAPPPLGEGFLFAARLDLEKGVKLLLDAWELSGLGETEELVIAGDGPLRLMVEAAATRLPGVTYVGRVDRSAVTTLVVRAAAVAVPSICYEGFPTQIVEAFASGRPVVATALGEAPGAVGTERGWVALPEPRRFAEALQEAAQPGAARERSSAARLAYESRHTPEAMMRNLLRAYAIVAQEGQS